MSIESIQSFYEEYYGVANKASLVAIGSMDVDMVKTYFEDNFSDFKSDKPFSVIENPFKTPLKHFLQGSGGEIYTVFDEESESDVENLQKPKENKKK